MTASARVVGIVLIVAGAAIAVGGTVWLTLGRGEGTLKGSGLALGLVGCYTVLVLPLVAGGVYFLLRGRQEAVETAQVQQQRRLMDIVSTRGQIQIADLVLEMRSTRDQVQQDLYDLVGRGLFSGYVDWSKGVLYSVEARQLQGRQTCPNCGGPLALAGKGLIKFPYCGAEIFLSG